MKIILNGEFRELSDGTTIAEVLDEIQLKSRMYAVEVNREIIPKSRHGEHRLADGDVMEVVHPVGGG